MTRETYEKLKKMGMNFPPNFEERMVVPLERQRENLAKEDTEQFAKNAAIANDSKTDLLKLRNANEDNYRTSINLAVVLEKNGKDQFDKVANDVWRVKYFTTLADIQEIRDLNKIYNYKNICIVHHGNTFSDHTFTDDNLLILGPNAFKNIRNVLSQMPPVKEITDDCILKVYEKSLMVYKDGLPLNKIKGFFSLQLLFENLLDNGCFFSIACNEADDPSFTELLAGFSQRPIKVFTSSNYTTIEDSSTTFFAPLNITISHSILNSFLTDSTYWKDSKGWIYYDTQTQETVVTKKDLWLYSKNSSKVYELLTRTKKLSEQQSSEETAAQLLFSKKFVAAYVKQYGQSAFDIYKKKTENLYPRLIIKKK